MAKRNENAKPRDERFDKAERFAEQYELSDTLKQTCDIFIDNYVNHISQYYAVAPIGTPIHFESYICAFTKNIGGVFSCYTLVFGDKIYRLPSEILDELKSEDDVFGKTYCMFKYIRKSINILFGLLYSKDKPRFEGVMNTQEVKLSNDGDAVEANVLKVSYCFRYKANNRVDPFNNDRKPV